MCILFLYRPRRRTRRRRRRRIGETHFEPNTIFNRRPSAFRRIEKDEKPGKHTKKPTQPSGGGWWLWRSVISADGRRAGCGGGGVCVRLPPPIRLVFRRDVCGATVCAGALLSTVKAFCRHRVRISNRVTDRPTVDLQCDRGTRANSSLYATATPKNPFPVCISYYQLFPASNLSRSFFHVGFSPVGKLPEGGQLEKPPTGQKKKSLFL